MKREKYVFYLKKGKEKLLTEKYGFKYNEYYKQYRWYDKYYPVYRIAVVKILY